MNRIPCQYAIVRFSPYIETGEFANAGIVLLAPQQSFFVFKLVTQRHARITRFFHELDAGVYRAAIKMQSAELTRIQTMLDGQNSKFAKDIFAELIRPREAMIRFSKMRVVLAGSVRKKLDELFAFYVERDFVAREHQEAALEKTLRDWLREAELKKRFKEERVGNRCYAVSFPFVEHRHEQAVKIIKPLYLGHENLNLLIDHGGRWINSINELKNRDTLPNRVLFTVKTTTKTSDHDKECQRIVGRLKNEGVVVLPHESKHEILRFAA